jgi:hypothetical protein
MGAQTEVLQLADLAYDQVVIHSGNKYKKYVQFFRVLIDGLSEKAAESQCSIEEVSLEPMEISELLGRKPEDHEFEKKHINKNLMPYLLRDLEVIQPTINNEALRKNFRKRLVPIKVSGEKNRISYGIKLDELTEQELDDSNIKESSELQSGCVIDYRLTQRPKPNFLGKYLSKLTLDKRSLWLYFLIPGLPLISMLAWFEFIFIGKAYSQIIWFLIITVVLGALWWLIKPFYSLLDRGISLAPIWMIPLKTRSAQLEKRATKKIGPLGRPVKELVFVVYEGECPICGGEVDIIQGKKQHKDRLIGQCTNNGVEHIFSFDQITKKGVPLRNDIYKG